MDNKAGKGIITCTCRVCGKKYTLTKGKINYFKSRNLELPKRCQECIENKRYRSDDDYYGRGLQQNTYQQALDLYGPRINVNGGLMDSPGFEYTGNDGNYDHFTQSFVGKKRDFKR
jgi:hypothetical protein